MKICFVSVLTFIISFSLFSQEGLDKKIVFNDSIYDPFFSAIITDNEGEKFNISRFSFYDDYNEKKFFFWVRRNSGLYNLSFKNIKSLKFNPEDFADDKYEGFTRAQLELVTGDTYLIYLKTTGHLEGYDETFASPVTFYLHYNLITEIAFKHEGKYKICPFCETIYFDTENNECVYDSTPLIVGVESASDK